MKRRRIIPRTRLQVALILTCREDLHADSLSGAILGASAGRGTFLADDAPKAREAARIAGWRLHRDGTATCKVCNTVQEWQKKNKTHPVRKDPVADN